MISNLSKRDKIIVGGVAAGVVLFGGYALGNNDRDAIPSTVDTTTPAIIETVAEISTEPITAETTIVITSVQETEPPKTEPEKTEPPEISAPIVTEPPAQTTVQTVAQTQENHFDDHYNPENQNTTEYVLNTKTHKVHKPTCKDVVKISEENYATTKDLNWAKSQGYTACGHCNPF